MLRRCGSPIAHKRIIKADQWPDEVHRASIGQGVYCWDNLSSAERYMQLRQADCADNLYIVPLSITADDLALLEVCDLRLYDDDVVNEWLNRHHRIHAGEPHYCDYVIRGQNLGDEHVFSEEAFTLFDIGEPFKPNL